VAPPDRVRLYQQERLIQTQEYKQEPILSAARKRVNEARDRAWLQAQPRQAWPARLHRQ
jgi:hypothetical protein